MGLWQRKFCQFSLGCLLTCECAACRRCTGTHSGSGLGALDSMRVSFCSGTQASSCIWSEILSVLLPGEHSGKALSLFGVLVAFVCLGSRTAFGTSHCYPLPATDQSVWVPTVELALRGEISARPPEPLSSLCAGFESPGGSVAARFAA